MRELQCIGAGSVLTLNLVTLATMELGFPFKWVYAVLMIMALVALFIGTLRRNAT